MKINDLKNTKIYLSNDEDRAKFQKKVFQLGVEWKVGRPKKIVIGQPFFYIDSNLKLSFSYLSQPNDFIHCIDRQIFLEHVLLIEEPEEKCTLKPYDRILVRNADNKRWYPREFSWYDADDKDGSKYEATDGVYYKQCIPYKDNEHLANTTNNPE